MMWRAIRRLVKESILWMLFLTSIVKGIDIPNRQQIEETTRIIKGQAPETLSIIYYGEETGEIEEVVFKKVLNTIPSSLLPIFDLDANTDVILKPRLNTFLAVCYHGINTHSAVTYFPHTDTLHGVIDYRFYIRDLPRTQSKNPDVVKSFMHPMEGNEFPQVPFEVGPDVINRERRMIGKLNSHDHSHCFLHKKYKKKLYAEVLLVIDSNMRANYCNNEGDHEKIVMYALAYWNAVDMLFSHLKHTQIQINIAGIVVGSTTNVLEKFLPIGTYTVNGDGQIYVMKHVALDGVGTFIENSWLEIPRMSFDFLIWMTQASLLTSYGKNSTGPDLGIAAPPDKCGGFHDDEDEPQTIVNRAVVMHDAKFTNYHTAARVLASMMFVSIDDVRRQDGLSKGMSRGIMDPANLRVEGCLRWSYQSEFDFLEYISSESSCCLLNFPYRTMEKPFTHIQKLTVDEQCQCYKFPTPVYTNKSPHYCAMSLECMDENEMKKSVAFLLDGTPCERSDRPGFCRAFECV